MKHLHQQLMCLCLTVLPATSLCLWAVPEDVNNNYVTVSTHLGTLRGKVISGHGRDVAAFYGIPFAQPPTGKYPELQVYV